MQRAFSPGGQARRALITPAASARLRLACRSRVRGRCCGLGAAAWRLASPVGISAGNAMLASQLAAALREADASSRDPSELAGHVAAIARTRACPACAVLAGIDREAAGELAAQALAAAEPPRLCLRHLALVLDARPSLPAGQAMTSLLVAALQRA